ncbi:MAG: intracellular growth attenuator family protein [Acidimicrobiia bacterium]|nr:intracellular growth attenuator family protein [Acidimicrobiia bacterium]
MDNFGDYLAPLGSDGAPPPMPALSVYVSSTLDDFGDLRRLLQGLPSGLDVPVEVQNLDEGATVKPISESLTRAGEADLLLLLLGSRSGPTIPGDHRTRIQAEYEAAVRKGRDVIVYEQIAAPGVETDERLSRFKDELRDHHTIGTLDQLADALQYEVIHDRLVKWLNETGRTQQTSALVALGEKLVVSLDDHWQDHRINQLDRWVMGLPFRRSESGTASLVERANDDWNEACLAFELRAANVMKLHLNRVVRMRPLDGKARYWLGRLLMTSASSRSDWKEVLRHIEVATRVYEHDQPKGAATGLGHLVQAKCLRHMGELERAQRSVREALDRLEWHSETHLEACYLELVADNIRIAEDHLHDAFHRFPPSFDFVEDEVVDLAGGSVAHTRVRHRLLLEVRRHLSDMHQFEMDVGRAINLARRRNADTEVLLGFINGFTVSIGGATGDTRSLTPGVVLGSGDEPDESPVRQAPLDHATVKPVGNNDGVTAVAVQSSDPVRLANLGRSLSTLNHTRLVDLEYQVERGFAMYAESRNHTNELREETALQRRNGFIAGACLLALILFVGLIGQMSPVTTALLAWLAVLGTVAGGWWWNRGRIQRSTAATERTLAQLKNTVGDFEQLVGRYEKVHTVLRYYVPLVDDPWGDRRLWRLQAGSGVFSLVSNDVLAPHIRDAVGGFPLSPQTSLRLYRATPGAGRSAQAERWRAYASSAAIVFHDPSPTLKAAPAETTPAPDPAKKA